MNDTMFNILDSVEDDDLVQVVPVRGVSDPAKLGSATDGKYYARAGDLPGGSSEVPILTGAAPTVLSFTAGSVFSVTTRGIIGTDIIQLPAFPDVEDGQECTIVYHAATGGDNITTLQIAQQDGNNIRIRSLPPLMGIVSFLSLDMNDFGSATFRCVDNGTSWYLEELHIAPVSDVTFNSMNLTDFPTTDQGDGVTIWCDTAAGRVLKLST